MFLNKLFGSGSVEKDTKASKEESNYRYSQIENEILLLKTENIRLQAELTELRLTMGIVATATQTLSEDLGGAYDMIQKIMGAGSGAPRFRFSFRDTDDDPIN